MDIDDPSDPDSDPNDDCNEGDLEGTCPDVHPIFTTKYKTMEEIVKAVKHWGKT